MFASNGDRFPPCGEPSSVSTVVIEDEDIRDYDGAEVIVTLLNYPQKKVRKAPVDWDSFVISSERGKHVDEYMKEMRENDRL